LIGTQGATGDKGPQGDPGSGGGGTTGGLPVLNVLTDLVGLGYPCNAKQGTSLSGLPAGVAAGGDPIQYAINYFIKNPGEYYAIYIPPGDYYISKPLMILDFENFVSCEIISTANVSFPDAGVTGGARIQWKDGLVYSSELGTNVRIGSDVPMLIIQSARRVSIQGIQFKGKNLATTKMMEDHFLGLFAVPTITTDGSGNKVISSIRGSDFEDFYDEDIRSIPFSPACCVAIDPFMNALPGGLASNMYPDHYAGHNYIAGLTTDPATNVDDDINVVDYYVGGENISVSSIGPASEAREILVNLGEGNVSVENYYLTLRDYYNRGRHLTNDSGDPLYDADSSRPKSGDYYRGFERSSSAVTFKNCTFSSNFIGTAISPAGAACPVNLSAPTSYTYTRSDSTTYLVQRPSYVNSQWTGVGNDRTQNCENFVFERCNWEYNTIQYSTGQSQARQNTIYQSAMFGSFISIDTEFVGPKGNPGVVPQFVGAQNIGGTKYVFNIGIATQNFTIRDLYFESAASLGRIAFGKSSTNGVALVEGGSFTIMYPGEVGSAAQSSGGLITKPNTKNINLPSIPFHLSARGGTTVFNGCTFVCQDDILRFETLDHDGARLVFNNCHIGSPDSERKEMTNDAISGIWNLQTAANKSTAKIGFSHPKDGATSIRVPSISFRADKNGGYGARHENVGIPGMQQYATISTSGNYNGIQITEVAGSNGSKGTFTISSLPTLSYRQDLTSSDTSTTSVGNVATGDLIRFASSIYRPHLITGIPHHLGRNVVIESDETLAAVSVGGFDTLAPHSRASYVGPFGILSNIERVGSSFRITIDKLPHGFPFGTSINVSFFRWSLDIPIVPKQTSSSIL
jgi:hypothetical protein